MVISNPKDRIQRILLILFAILLSVALTACDTVKINTTTTINKDNSGTRLMIVALDKGNGENKVIKKDANELQRVVKENTPKELSFAGLEEKDNKYYLKFNLDFKDFDDYTNKVNALLKAKEESDKSINSSSTNKSKPVNNIYIKNYNTPLLKGMVVRGDLKSSDLLAWIRKPLVENAIIDSSTARYALNDYGSENVVVDGKTYEINDRRNGLALGKELVDNAFSYVKLEFDMSQGSAKEATIYYVLDDNNRAEQVEATKNYLQGLKDVNVESVNPSDFNDYYRYSNYAIINKINLKESDSQKLLKRVQSLIGASKLEIGLEKPEVKSDKNPVEITQTLKVVGDCGEICSPTGKGLLTSIKLPDGTKIVDEAAGVNNESKDEQVILSGENSWDAKISVNALVEEINTKVFINGEKSLSAEVNFTTAKDSNKDLVKLMADIFKKQYGKDGKVEAKENNIKITYNGGDSTKLAKELEGLFEKPQVSFKQQESGYFGGKVFAQAKLPLASIPFISVKKISMEIVPGGSYSLANEGKSAKKSISVKDSENYRNNNQDSWEVYAELQYTNWWGYLGLTILLVLGLIVALIAYSKRNKIKAKLAAMKPAYTAGAAAPANYNYTAYPAQSANAPTTYPDTQDYGYGQQTTGMPEVAQQINPYPPQPSTAQPVNSDQQYYDYGQNYQHTEQLPPYGQNRQ